MLISNALTLVKRGVLKQLSVDETDLLSYLNMAMTEVYKKFDINIREQILTLDSNINEYALSADVMIITSAYTQSSYLKDAYGNAINSSAENRVVSISVNDEDDSNSVFTPSNGVLLVPFPTTDQVISLVYKASPEEITETDLEKELQLAPQYMEPLFMYIGYLGYLSHDSGIQTDNDNYLLKFERACRVIQDLGLTNVNVSTNRKLEQKGFP